MADRWFVVFRRQGMLSPSVYHDYLPSFVTGKRAKQDGVFHVKQLDADDERTLNEIWDEYQRGLPAALRRDLAYKQGNEAHPLPLSGTKEAP
jgi:hypothetical protein